MAKRKAAKKRAKQAVRRKPMVRKTAKKKATKKKAAVRKAPKKKVASKRPARRAAASAPPPAAASRLNAITHTELASADPAATQAWCEQVLGWQFMPAMPMPDGEYRMWRFDIGTGGGIRGAGPGEPTGSIPYLEVADIRAIYGAAIAAGAQEMMAPTALPGGMGSVAVLIAPGGVAIGLWAAS